MVTSFRYLGRVILESDDEWPAVVKNLSRARDVWRRMTRILSRDGLALRVSGFFFKDVVQAVLLFGSDTWLVTPCIGKSMGGVHAQVAKRLMGRLPWRTLDRKWT